MSTTRLLETSAKSIWVQAAMFLWNIFTWNIAFPTGIYLHKVSNGSTRTRCEICSKLIIKTHERRQRLGRYFTPFSSVSIATFERVIAGWVQYIPSPQTLFEQLPKVNLHHIVDISFLSIHRFSTFLPILGVKLQL